MYSPESFLTKRNTVPARNRVPSQTYFKIHSGVYLLEPFVFIRDLFCNVHRQTLAASLSITQSSFRRFTLRRCELLLWHQREHRHHRIVIRLALRGAISGLRGCEIGIDMQNIHAAQQIHQIGSQKNMI